MTKYAILEQQDVQLANSIRQTGQAIARHGRLQTPTSSSWAKRIT